MTRRISTHARTEEERREKEEEMNRVREKGRKEKRECGRNGRGAQIRVPQGLIYGTQ
jgi:hypothetical protein